VSPAELDALEAAAKTYLAMMPIDVNVVLRLVAALREARAERDELAAEVAAYQGKPEGALPGWHWNDSGDYQAFERAWHLWPVPNGVPDGWVVWAETDGRWGCWHYTGISDMLDVNEQGTEPTPRAAMRAAEAAYDAWCDR
jgi:hypothetical protein